jgi:hypothetical protein
VELTALVIEIAARHCKQVRPVLHRLREMHDNFGVAPAQHLHLLGFAEDGRRLFTEVETAQRGGFVICVNERGKHHDLLPAIEVVETAVGIRLGVFLQPTGSLYTIGNADDHHRRCGELEIASLHESLPLVSQQGAIDGPAAVHGPNHLLMWWLRHDYDSETDRKNCKSG